MFYKHTVMICVCILWDTAYKTSSCKNSCQEVKLEVPCVTISKYI